METTVGVVLLVLGAVGATVTQRELESSRRARWIPLALAPFGVLIGAGAAFVRGWALPSAMVLGAVVIPVVAIVARMIEVRRGRSRG